MRKCNRKVWTVDPTEMNSIWVGAYVAVPNVNGIRTKLPKLNKLTRMTQKQKIQSGDLTISLSFHAMEELVQFGRVLQAYFHRDGSTFIKRS